MGAGGVVSWRDAVEFIMAGARLVQIGAGIFIKPSLPLDILEGMESWLEAEGIGGIGEIRGIL
jgi:dihydroorotate dehydrogenase (NAD+) catalytic subunit